MGASAARIESDARGVAAQRAAQIAALDAQLAKIAPRGRRTPTASQRARQAPLLAQRAALQGQMEGAEQVAAQAQSLFSLVAERRREGFSARVLTRSPSPLSPGFWASLATEADDDGARLEDMAADAAQTVVAAPEPRGAVALTAALLAAAALVLLVRRGLDKLGRRKTRKAGDAGFARTGTALLAAAGDILAARGSTSGFR